MMAVQKKMIFEHSFNDDGTIFFKKDFKSATLKAEFKNNNGLLNTNFCRNDIKIEISTLSENEQNVFVHMTKAYLELEGEYF